MECDKGVMKKGQQNTAVAVVIDYCTDRRVGLIRSPKKDEPDLREREKRFQLRDLDWNHAHKTTAC